MAKPTKISEYKEIFDAFLKGYTDQLKDNKVLLPFNFNILDAQCGTIKENSHTNILMKLLEYRDQYGYYVFLEDFINQLTGFNVSIDLQNSVKFKTEYFDAVQIIANDNSTKNKTKQGRTDGLIYQEGEFAIIFENKVNGAPPQPNQLERYIRSVLGEGRNNHIVDCTEKVFVVLLTKDGVEPPDNESIEYMQDKGILNKPEPNDSSKLISGQRYFACSYRYDILPWLENSVQPLVYQKELVLNTGLIQYIDFLKGMLGQREGQTLLREHCKNIFETIINKYITNYIQKYKTDKLKKQNEYLHKLYIYLQKELRKYQKKSDSNSKIQVDCINMLQSLVYEKAEEPMLDFMKATKEFFTSGDSNNPPLIEEKDYLVNHHFTFYYIVIRDNNWPRGVYVGWSLAQFLKDEPDAVLFYQKPSDDEPKDGCKDDNSFIYSAKGKAWRKKYSSDLPRINGEQFDGDKLKTLYDNSGIKTIIGSINLKPQE